MTELIWKERKSNCIAVDGYAGKIRLFTISWNMSAPRGSTGTEYVLRGSLPGMETYETASSIEHLETRAQSMWEQWLVSVGVTPNVP